MLVNNVGAGAKDIYNGLIERFIQAAQCGDDVTLKALLADEVTIISDGGGKPSSVYSTDRGSSTGRRMALNTGCETLSYDDLVVRITIMRTQSEAVVSPSADAASEKISIYVDNNVWDFMPDRKLDLGAELPGDEFCACITREAEFEIPAVPIKKSGLKAFIGATIAKCDMRTDCFFDFYDDSLPQHEQRVAGFDQGRWTSPEEVRSSLGNKLR